MDESTTDSAASVPTKRCRRCHRVLPVSAFWKRARSPDGFNPWCISCRLGQSCIDKDARRGRSFGSVSEKCCASCGRVLPLEAFSRQVLGQYGRRSQCKECTRLYDRAWDARRPKRKPKPLVLPPTRVCHRCDIERPFADFYAVIQGNRLYSSKAPCRNCVVGDSLWSITPAFGYWLAGLTDGEGCFMIDRVERIRDGLARVYWRCAFRITLRADDREVLQYIQRELGFGTLIRGGSSGKPNAHPAITYQLGSITEARCLVDIFWRYPLRAKKSRDFLIWRQAVLLLYGYGSSSERDTQMQKLKAALEAGRRYRERDA